MDNYFFFFYLPPGGEFLVFLFSKFNQFYCIKICTSIDSKIIGIQPYSSVTCSLKLSISWPNASSVISRSSAVIPSTLFPKEGSEAIGRQFNRVLGEKESGGDVLEDNEIDGDVIGVEKPVAVLEKGETDGDGVPMIVGVG